MRRSLQGLGHGRNDCGIVALRRATRPLSYRLFPTITPATSSSQIDGQSVGGMDLARERRNTANRGHLPIRNVKPDGAFHL
jgi:hypothetical protein